MGPQALGAFRIPGAFQGEKMRREGGAGPPQQSYGMPPTILTSGLGKGVAATRKQPKLDWATLAEAQRPTGAAGV